MKVLFWAVVLASLGLLVSGLELDQEKPKRRRKLRRKVKKSSSEGSDDVTFETPDPLKVESSEVVILARDNGGLLDLKNIENEDLDRSGRGFLDQYYSQFEHRVPQQQQSVERKTGKAMLHQEDLTPQGSIRLTSQALYDDLDEALLEDYGDYDLSDLDLATLQQPASPNTRYIQHVSLPKSGPADDSTYMYSAVHPSELKELEDLSTDSTDIPQEPRKILPGFLYTGTKQMKEDMMDMDKLSFEPSTHLEYTSDDSLLDRDGGSHHHHHQSSSYDAPSTSYKTAESSGTPLTKFLGLTGTTSQNIQLGLTFTVPFLSVPLTSLNSVFEGNGLSGLFENVDFSTIFTVAAIAATGIFIVPYMIYWLTGINLSAFSGFGRSDTDGEDGIPLMGLMRSVEDALAEYNIDTRTCLARTMCNQYSTRSTTDDTPDRVGRGILENLAKHKYVKKYVGESRVQEALTHGSKNSCAQFYKKDVCPWDGAAMMKIVTSLITSGKIDFASIAAAAAQAAANNFVKK